MQAVDLGEHALRVAEDHAALRGELDLAARAAEDLDAELLSSRRICCEIADWARYSSSAAFVNEPWRATAAMVRR